VADEVKCLLHIINDVANGGSNSSMNQAIRLQRLKSPNPSATTQITNGQTNLTQGHICRPMRAHWRHLANTIELALPSAHPSPHTKRQIDRFSRVCTAHA